VTSPPPGPARPKGKSARRARVAAGQLTWSRLCVVGVGSPRSGWPRTTSRCSASCV